MHNFRGKGQIPQLGSKFRSPRKTVGPSYDFLVVSSLQSGRFRARSTASVKVVLHCLHQGHSWLCQWLTTNTPDETGVKLYCCSQITYRCQWPSCVETATRQTSIPLFKVLSKLNWWNQKIEQLRHCESCQVSE